MDRVIQVGNLLPDSDNFKNRTTGRVYSIEGLAPTLNTCQGGGKIPLIEVYETNRVQVPTISQRDE